MLAAVIVLKRPRFYKLQFLGLCHRHYKKLPSRFLPLKSLHHVFVHFLYNLQLPSKVFHFLVLVQSKFCQMENNIS